MEGFALQQSVDGNAFPVGFAEGREVRSDQLDGWDITEAIDSTTEGRRARQGRKSGPILGPLQAIALPPVQSGQGRWLIPDTENSRQKARQRFTIDHPVNGWIATMNPALQQLLQRN